MPDEVTADDSSVPFSLELERVVVDMLLAICEADEALETDERAAVLQTVTVLAKFVQQAANHLRDDNPTTGALPGVALHRLLMALIDQNANGIVGPLLSPRRRAETGKNKGNNKLFLNVRVARLRVAVATELLFRARGSLAEVTEEVAGILKGHSILTNRKGKFFSGERTVRRWRSEIVADVSSFDAKEYNKILDQITSQVRARGGGPDELVQAAHAMLQNLEKTTLPD
jgi:hypothetical protein